MSAKKNVVVVGGGYGALTARLLDTALAKLGKDKYEIILINPTPYRVWMIAAARMAVTDETSNGNGVIPLEQRAIVPFDKLFPKGLGTFKEGKVISIETGAGSEGGTVTLASGEHIPFVVLLLAPGSVWEGPLNFPENSEHLDAFIANSRKTFKDAKSVAIIGGGAVGSELSGELKDVYPDKTITIIHSQPLILNSTYPDRFRRGVEANIRGRGTELVLDDAVEASDIPTGGLGKTQSGHITTRKGIVIDADVVVAARGPKPNTKFIISSLGSDVATPSGHLKTLPTFQLRSHPFIFAQGDVVDLPEQHSAAKAGAHAAVVAANIAAYLQKGKDARLKNYSKQPEVLILTNGKSRGQAYFGMLWGLHFGDWLVRLFKGKSLMIWLVKSEVGQS